MSISNPPPPHPLSLHTGWDATPELRCYHQEGGVREVRKPQNRTEIRQKTANRIGFFPEYRNRTYMESTM